MTQPPLVVYPFSLLFFLLSNKNLGLAAHSLSISIYCCSGGYKVHFGLWSDGQPDNEVQEQDTRR
jgi:hypothetical protein